MCIWNISVEDRHCEYCSYRGGCERYPVIRMPAAEDVAAEYAEIMSEILGEDVLARTRKPIVVCGRDIIAYQMRLDGFSLQSIARCLGLTHTTVMHGIRYFKGMLDYPKMFRMENDIWNKFQKKISL